MSSESNIMFYAYTNLRPVIEQSFDENPNLIKSLLAPETLSEEDLFSIFTKSVHPIKNYSLFLLFERLTLNPMQPQRIDQLIILENLIDLFPNCKESICSNFKSYLQTLIMNIDPTSNNLENILLMLAFCSRLNVDISVEKQFFATKLQLFCWNSLSILKYNWDYNRVLRLISIVSRVKIAGIDDKILLNHLIAQILNAVIENYDFNDFKKVSKEPYNENIIEAKYIFKKFVDTTGFDDENMGKIFFIQEKFKSLIPDENTEWLENSMKCINWRQVPKYRRETEDFIVEVVLGESPDGKLIAKKSYFLKNNSKISSIHKEIKVIEKLSQNIRTEDCCFLKFYGSELRENYIIIYMEGYEDTLIEYLSELEKKKKKLSKKKLRIFIRKLIDTYADMENLNIIHRDIKPNNILISKNRKNLKIIDFGVSETESSYLSTGFHPIKGTKKYMAPEIYSSFIKKLDICEHSPVKADVFSLGLTIYQMVTLEGISFMNQENSTQLLSDHLRTLELDQWVKKLIVFMLEPNYQARISFKECLESIEDEGTIYN